MARFMVLYTSPVSPREMMAQATPEEMQAGMDEWMAWSGRAGDAVKDLGAPLAAALTIRSEGTEASGSKVAGYSFIEADSVDAAAGLLDGHPHLRTPGGSIELLEFLAMPGM